MPFLYIHWAPTYYKDERICSWKCKPTELIKIISHALIVALPCTAVLLDERAGLELDLKWVSHNSRACPVNRSISYIDWVLWEFEFQIALWECCWHVLFTVAYNYINHMFIFLTHSDSAGYIPWLERRCWSLCSGVWRKCTQRCCSYYISQVCHFTMTLLWVTKSVFKMSTWILIFIVFKCKTAWWEFPVQFVLQLSLAME